MEAGKYLHNEIEDAHIVRDAKACKKKCQSKPNCHFWTFYYTGLCTLHNKYAPYHPEYHPEAVRGPRVCQQGLFSRIALNNEYNLGYKN